ncbi:MAG: MFS transporter [Methanoregulaceae archaeon]|nr:MFS transporter [Methanoregulaceae archaeon]
MRNRFPLFFGVFIVMALSNAIVPDLASFGDSTITQGAIYSAYFLGAFLFVLPAGLLSDRAGELPLVRAGLVLTVISGVLLFSSTSTLLIVIFRFIEGIGAGLFVPAALSLINARPDHETSSGYFMALLNIGLVAGLIGSGWLTEVTGVGSSGIATFTLIGVIPALASMFMQSGTGRVRLHDESIRETGERLLRVSREYFWLWVSTIVILGITGALTVLYPEFSDLSPGILGVTIAAMSISTAIAVIVVAHAHLSPIPTIKGASLAMAAAVLSVFVSPVFFILVGAIAGVVMIAQLAFLAESEDRQGVVMGLFNAASYGGMTFLPFIAGFIAEITTFFIAFFIIALFAVGVAFTIGRCRCHLP